MTLKTRLDILQKFALHVDKAILISFVTICCRIVKFLCFRKNMLNRTSRVCFFGVRISTEFILTVLNFLSYNSAVHCSIYMHKSILLHDLRPPPLAFIPCKLS